MAAADVPARSAAETCGFVPASSASDVERELPVDPAAGRRLAQANQDVADALQRSPDERMRAAGLVLQSSNAVSAGYATEPASAPETCGRDCVKIIGNPFTSFIRYGQPATDALARAASATRDPFVYALGLKLCGSPTLGNVSPAPSCQLLSAEQWARMEPDNADAWMHVAEHAAVRKDDAGLADAMNHLSHATVNRGYADQAGAIIDAAIPPGPDEMALWVMNMGTIVGTLSWSPVATATSYCAAAAMADSNRAQVCDRVAHVLTERSSRLVDQRIGIRIGERAGWPAEQVAAMRSENDALNRVLGSSFPFVADCGAFERERVQWRSRLLSGELVAARAAAVATGKSMSVLVQEARDLRAAESRQVQVSTGAAPQK
jgi:hypothetical protein